MNNRIIIDVETSSKVDSDQMVEIVKQLLEQGKSQLLNCAKNQVEYSGIGMLLANMNFICTKG